MKLNIKGKYLVQDHNTICKMLSDIGYHDFTKYKSILLYAEALELEDGEKFHFFYRPSKAKGCVKLTSHTLTDSFIRNYINPSMKQNYTKYDNSEFLYFTGYTIATTNSSQMPYVYTGISESYVSYDNMIHMKDTHHSRYQHIYNKYSQLKNKYVTYALSVLEGNTTGSASVCIYGNDAFKTYNAISNLTAYPQDRKYEEDELGAISIYGDCFVRMSSNHMNHIREYRSSVTHFLLTGRSS